MTQPASHYFSSSEPLERAARQLQIAAGGVTLQFVTGNGVFSKSALDEGSRLLIEVTRRHVFWPPGAHIADIGCGWGAIACFAAALAPQCLVFGCDINERAVALAHRNAGQNELANAFFWCGDGLDAARDGCFDTIFCNPPVRAGNETIERLFNGARRCMKPDGELWVVLRTAQGAKSWQRRLEKLFGDCQTMEIKHGYRILRCKMKI